MNRARIPGLVRDDDPRRASGLAQHLLGALTDRGLILALALLLGDAITIANLLGRGPREAVIELFEGQEAD